MKAAAIERFVDGRALGQRVGTDDLLFSHLTASKENHMKTVFLAALLALSVTALPSAMGADEQEAHGDHHKSETTATATHAGRGKVNSVNLEAGTINLTHGPIKSLKWPKMTMDFKARNPAMLKVLKPGDPVDFDLMKMSGGYQIVKISPSTD
jgi:Cu/Ag efflux protein CusF